MEFPPDLQASAATAVTTAGGNASTTVVTSPGPGQRLRVWAWGAQLAHSTAGPTGVEFEFREAVGAVTKGWGSALAAGPRETWHELPGGLALAADTGAQIATRITPGAVQTVHLSVYWTVEETG